jgi:nickel/cobalt transporter (NicO) family protein
MAFGGAGGLIPCPAAVTVMLLSFSVSKTASGLFLVVGFSLGLALTLVSVGLAVVMGLSKLAGTGRLSWLSKQAPVISASLVILSGAIGLALAV